MFKTIALLKRRPDLTMEQFIERYQTGHSKLGERLLRGRATKYVRRFLHPVAKLDTGEKVEGDADVVMEIWYADRAKWEEATAYLSQPDIQAEIIADEETLFDRSKSRFFLVEEHESEL